MTMSSCVPTFTHFHSLFAPKARYWKSMGCAGGCKGK
jgi:hypothetical protein